MRLPWSILLAVGCAPEAASEPVVVAATDGWTLGSLATDPVPAHQPEVPLCPPATWGYEDGRLEVQTGACDYAWLVQPLLGPLEEGDTLTMLTWHQGLDASEPAEGHLALSVDGVLRWEMWAPIPSLPDVFEAEVVMDAHVPAGAEVGIHLHNHGFNSWSVGEITRR